MSNLNNQKTMREVARELRPDWTNEQFEAHWESYINLRWSVARGRRKKGAALAREAQKAT